jgi:16S rRNA G966 N2-methylase RsmD
MQRVGSGTLRGRVLRPLPTGVVGVRPTGSRVREAIFDRLQSEVRGAAVLDLFAGTGALAIEALSRGAARATLVDVQPRVVRYLQEQIRELSLADRATVWRADAGQFLRSPPIAASPHDLVLLDPPYDETAAAGARPARRADRRWMARRRRARRVRVRPVPRSPAGQRRRDGPARPRGHMARPASTFSAGPRRESRYSGAPWPPSTSRPTPAPPC